MYMPNRIWQVSCCRVRKSMGEVEHRYIDRIRIWIAPFDQEVKWNFCFDFVNSCNMSQTNSEVPKNAKRIEIPKEKVFIMIDRVAEESWIWDTRHRNYQ